jgi:hypothetical protein
MAPPFLNSALDGGEWSASHPGRFTPRETAQATHLTGGCMGHTADLDTGEEKLASTGNRSSAIEPVARRYTD